MLDVAEETREARGAAAGEKAAREAVLAAKRQQLKAEFVKKRLQKLQSGGGGGSGGAGGGGAG